LAPRAERAARFREFTEIVNGLLQSSETPFTFEGRYYSTYETTIAPAPVQQPRPPITVGGQSPSVRRIAVQRAECWNTFALGEAPFDEILGSVRAQNRELDEQCAEVNRDPATLRRSLVLWRLLDPWESPEAFERIVVSFQDAGISEFNVMWPGDDRLPLLEQVAATIAALRER
jgi:alkanesulfonate monooxygenase SsuD/methylene tetrahydromethanopterin reductase-like flavin-dependent oxidoreductase (luciferase family)